MFYNNQFPTGFRLQVSFRYLLVDVKEHVRSGLLGKWLFLCLYSMYEIHKSNSIGCAVSLYGLCTYGWHRLDVAKDEIVCFAI